jgi:hypothetical protein
LNAGVARAGAFLPFASHHAHICATVPFSGGPLVSSGGRLALMDAAKASQASLLGGRPAAVLAASFAAANATSRGSTTVTPRGSASAYASPATSATDADSMLPSEASLAALAPDDARASMMDSVNASANRPHAIWAQRLFQK